MVTYEVVAYIVAGILVTGCVGIASLMALAWTVRRLTLGAGGAIKPDLTGYAPSGVDTTVLQALSERLAIIEGRYNALVPVIEGYGGVQARMSALEAHIPSVIDVTEKLGQTVLNADKRSAERTRRASKKDGEEGEMTVDAALAAQQMGQAANPAQASQPPALQRPLERRAGVVGQGGNGRPR